MSRLNSVVHKIIGDLEYVRHDKEMCPDDNEYLLGKQSLLEQAIYLLEYLIAPPKPVGETAGRAHWSCSCNFSHEIASKECNTCGAVRPPTEYRDKTVRYLAWSEE